MHMAFEQPFWLKPFGFHIGDDFIGGFGIGMAAGIVKIQNGIDDRTLVAVWIFDHKRNGVGGVVKKGFYFGGHFIAPEFLFVLR